MADDEGVRCPEATPSRAASEAVIARLEKEIAALEAERSRALPETSFNLKRGLSGGIPAGAVSALIGVAFMVMSLFKYGQVCVSVGGGLVFCAIGFLLYTLSCWSRWKAEEKKRLSSLAGLNRQIEEKREEIRRHRAIAAG